MLELESGTLNIELLTHLLGFVVQLIIQVNAVVYNVTVSTGVRNFFGFLVNGKRYTL